MQRKMLKSKIHRAVVTDSDLNYMGSITIDPQLLKTADILPGEQVQIVVLDNGQRFETYVIPGTEGSGQVCLNGAAARLVEKGDKVIIMSYVHVDDDEAQEMVSTVVFVDGDNKVAEVRAG